MKCNLNRLKNPQQNPLLGAIKQQKSEQYISGSAALVRSTMNKRVQTEIVSKMFLSSKRDDLREQKARWRSTRQPGRSGKKWKKINFKMAQIC